MLVSGAITHIRNLTGHDVDGQVNDSTMLLPWIEQEARVLRRRLSVACPTLFASTVAPTVVAPGAAAISVPAALGDMEHLLSVERLLSGTGSAPATDVWADVPVYVIGSPYLGYREEGLTLNLYPESQAPGSYRVKFILGLSAGAFTTSTNLNGGYSNSIVGLPVGMEYVVIHRVCALVSSRVPGDDPAPHEKEAERLWLQQLPALKKRYGRSVRQGFHSVKERDW